MWKKIKCFIDHHDWEYYQVNKGNIFHWPYRTCRNCGKLQRGSYDMMYGETVWE